MRNSSTFSTFFNSLNDDNSQFELDSEIEELLISLDIEDFTPRKRTVNNVLNFARSFEVIHSENAGLIEMNLN